MLVNLKGDAESKVKYYNALERSHTSGDPLPFRLLVVAAEVAALERYLNLLQG